MAAQNAIKWINSTLIKVACQEVKIHSSYVHLSGHYCDMMALICLLIQYLLFPLLFHFTDCIMYLSCRPLAHYSTVAHSESNNHELQKTHLKEFVDGELPWRPISQSHLVFKLTKKRWGEIVQLDGDWMLSSHSPHLYWIYNIIWDYFRNIGKGEDEFLLSQLCHCWIGS